MKPVHLLFCMVGVAGAIGLFVPRDRGPAIADAEVAQVDTDASPEQSFNWYGGEAVLERQPDGHFYADATVDGMPVHFLVDTGASVVALTGDDAYALGVSWDDNQIQPIGQGASGTIYGVPAMIDEMSLGGLRGSKVQAVIIPEGLPVSLLGQSFLSKVDNVEIAGDRMILGGG